MASSSEDLSNDQEKTLSDPGSTQSISSSSASLFSPSTSSSFSISPSTSTSNSLSQEADVPTLPLESVTRQPEDLATTRVSGPLLRKDSVGTKDAGSLAAQQMQANLLYAALQLTGESICIDPLPRKRTNSNSRSHRLASSSPSVSSSSPSRSRSSSASPSVSASSAPSLPTLGSPSAPLPSMLLSSSPLSSPVTSSTPTTTTSTSNLPPLEVRDRLLKTVLQLASDSLDDGDLPPIPDPLPKTRKKRKKKPTTM